MSYLEDDFEALLGAQSMGVGTPSEMQGIAVLCPFTLTIAGHKMHCQMEKGHHYQTEHSFSIDWAHEDSDSV